MTRKQKRTQPILAGSFAALTLSLALAVSALPGCDLIEKIPPIQLCVTYKGKTFCASKVNGQWRFEAELSPEERDEVIRHIEGK